MIPAAKPDELTRTQIKQAFRRHWGSKGLLANDIGVDLRRVSDWFGSRYKGVDATIVAAIRQRAADLINEERQKAKENRA